MNINNLLVYLPKSEYLNEATSFYIDMLCEGISNKESKIVYKLSELKGCDAVLVIDVKSFLFVKSRYPSMKVITWYQGIVPEEGLMFLNNSKIKFIYWSCFEFICLCFSFLNVFVSKAMHQHYVNKYKYKRLGGVVIPCFNKGIDHSIANQDRGFSFVYAGSLHKWQCIERMLSIFSAVQKKEPIATLEFYTFSVHDAEELIKKYSLKNTNIKRVELKDVDKEISKSKYGFLIREDHIVNNVATPTKINTYLSVGTRPILTDVIFDFKEKIDKNLCVYVSLHDADEQIADLIIADYRIKINELSFASARKNVFANYYNRDGYIKMLREI
ncbi:hypothetical protein [Aeromonas sp. S16(2024)]|uniref:hypothetical protein n=1 Tax=Aeromonas sp. S16(2024) TaxID=3242889 RepID=UPI0035276174